MRPNKSEKWDYGIISVFLLTLLALFLTTGLSMLEMKDASLGNVIDIARAGKARVLAQSALQDGKYYTMKVDSNWTGISQEQVVSVNGKQVGSYDFTTSKNGSVYTVSATGYVPNKSSSKKVTHTLSTSFTYNTIPVGILVLDATAGGALSMNGNAVVEVVGGRVMVNSNSKIGLLGTGNAKLSSPKVGVVGEYSLSGNAKIEGAVSIGQNPGLDPYALVPEPDPNTLIQRASSTTNITKNTTLDPGRYTGGINISSKAAVTLNPGLYYMQGGGFSVAGNASLSGSEVIIYNDPSKSSEGVNLSGTGALTLSAPGSGTYNGIVFFQKRASSASAAVTGNGNANVSGAFYFPGAGVSLTGNGAGDAIGSVHVVKTLTLGGNGSMNINTSSP